MADTADTVTLLVPRDRSFLPLLHMVLGGIGLRHDLSFDALDDLQLAVDNILAEDESEEAELTMEVTLGGPLLHISLSSLSGADLEHMLKEGAVPAGAEGRCIDVCVLLRSLVDAYQVRDLGEGRFALDMQKHVR